MYYQLFSGFEWFSLLRKSRKKYSSQNICFLLLQNKENIKNILQAQKLYFRGRKAQILRSLMLLEIFRPRNFWTIWADRINFLKTKTALFDKLIL